MAIFAGIAAIAGAGSSLIGGVLQNKANKAIAQKQMDFQREANQKQMDFQERMSNSAYQRSMDDMRLAGLNPILAYRQGGASSPGGATSAGAGIPAVNIMQGAATSAIAASRVALERKRTKAEIGNLHEDSSKKFSEQRLNQTLRNKSEQDLKNEKTRGQILLEDLQVRKADAATAKATKAFYDSEYGKVLRKIDLTGRSLNPFNSMRGRR